ncbi:hypothetical protein ABPG75_000592 [Micractinium tetrahymenae]
MWDTIWLASTAALSDAWAIHKGHAFVPGSSLRLQASAVEAARCRRKRGGKKTPQAPPARLGAILHCLYRVQRCRRNQEPGQGEQPSSLPPAAAHARPGLGAVL